MEIRDFFDPETLRKWVLEDTKKAFETQLNRIETPQHKLVVEDVHYKNEDKRPSVTEMHNAILDKKDITIPLIATAKLVNKKTGDVVDQKTFTIAQVPNITKRNSIIYAGTEYIPINQTRLRPGVYTRVQSNGLLGGQINPANGMQLHIVFHPDKGIFMLTVGTVNIHLYSILSDLGVSDSDMEKAWGKELLLKNKQGYKTDQIDKLYDKLFTFDK